MKSPTSKQVFYSLELLRLTKSDTQTLVLGHIAYHHAKHGAFNSSMGAIAKYLNYSVNAVKNAVLNLSNVVDKKGEPLIKVELSKESYNRRIKLNSKHELGFKLLQSYHQIVNQYGQTKQVLNLYSVRLNEFKTKHRYDSRHAHKVLMLKSLINTKIQSNLRNSKENKTTYKQTISMLMKKLEWSFVTIKNLISSIQAEQALIISLDRIKNAAVYVFTSITESVNVRQQPSEPKKVKGKDTPWLDKYQ